MAGFDESNFDESYFDEDAPHTGEIVAP